MSFAPRVSAEIAAALRAGRAVVALETTLVSHGFSAGRGLQAALDSEARVRAEGAVPADPGDPGRERLGQQEVENSSHPSSRRRSAAEGRTGSRCGRWPPARRRRPARLGPPAE